MEAVMMTGLTVGGLLVAPAIVEFLKQNWITLAAIAGIILLMGLLAPYVPAIDAIWQPLRHLPDLFVEAAVAAESGLNELSAQYYASFGGH